MDIGNRRALKDQAAARLAEQSRSPRYLAFVHTAAASLVLLVIMLLNYFLSRQVGTTAGLSGMGTRSVLQTVQTVLQYAVNIALPFWEIGFLFVAIRMARGEQVQIASLAEGFRRFGPVLRLMLLRGLIYVALAIVCIYLSSILYTLTPAAQTMMEQLMPLAESSVDMAQMESALMELPIDQLWGLFWPVFVIFGVLYGAVAICMFYRFWLADYLIMDKPGTGALAALATSSRLTRKNRFRLFRLDLSFWWYYILQLLATLLCYLDVLLTYTAVEVSMNADILSMLCYVLGLVVQMLLFTFAGSHLYTTRATAYDVLRQQAEEPPRPKPAPKSLPWEDYPA